MQLPSTPFFAFPDWMHRLNDAMARVMPRMLTLILGASLSFQALTPPAAQADAYDPPANYYDGALLLTGPALKSALNNIIDNHTIIVYGSVDEAQEVIDRDDLIPGNVILIYSGNTVSSSLYGSNAADGWNKEHTWPDSRGLQSNGPDYSDLHHLRPCDATVNSTRGNLPFDFNNGNTVPEAPFCKILNTVSFQVRPEDRGDIARGLFYMDVRYDGADSSTTDLTLVDSTALSANQMGKLSTLIQWHQADQPDTRERRRNHEIYSNYQQNRNPFIDHPEYVNLIWGDFSDTTPPQLYALSPLDDSQNASLTPTLYATFNENIFSGTGTASLRRTSDHSLVESATFPDARLSVSSATLSFQPTNTLAANTAYYVTLSANIVRDSSTNSFSGLTNTTAWNFTTVPQSTGSASAFADTFNRANANALGLSSTGSLPWSELETVSNTSIQIDSNALKLGSGTAGRDYAYVNLSTVSSYNNILANNTGALTWYINMRQSRTDPSGFDSSNYGLAFILASSMFTNIATGSGYAVVYGQSGSSDPLRLIRFTGGLNANSDTTTLTSAGDYGAEYHSIRVTFTPATREWKLYAESNAGSYPRTDPSQTATQLGATVVNTNYIFTALNYCGVLWNHSSGTSDSASVDEIGLSIPNAIAPQLLSLTPADESINVTQSALLQAHFDSALTASTGSIQIRRTANNSLFASIPVTGGMISNQTLLIDPPGLLEPSTAYHILLGSNCVKNSSDIPYTGLLNTNTWNFITGETNPPTAIAFSPADNSSNVTLTAILQLTFSEPVLAGSGNIFIRRSSDNSLLSSIPINSENLDSTLLTINPGTNFAFNTSYYVNYDAGLVTDLAGNSCAAFSGTSAWNFTTTNFVDSTPPSLASVSPAHLATDVSTNVVLLATFSESIQDGASGVARIRRFSDDFTVSTIPINSSAISGDTLQLAPAAPLPSSTTFYVEIDTGAVTDFASNAFSGITGSITWRFTTQAPPPETVPPVITSLSPVNGATNVSTNVVFIATFSEPIQDGASGSARLRRVSDDFPVATFSLTATNISGNTLTLTPAAPLATNTAFYVELDNNSLFDMANNSFSGITNNSTWRFTTQAPPPETVPPVITSLSPANGATNVSTNVVLIATFSEPIQDGPSGSARLRRISDDFTVATFSLTPTNISGNTLTLTPAAPLATNTAFYVELDNNSLFDMANNSFPGITNNSTWRFTTQAAPTETIPPVITSLSPANGATNISTNVVLIATFSEPIQDGPSGNATVRDFLTGSLFENINITAAQISGSNLTLIPTLTLTANRRYFIEIPAAAVRDLTGNAFPGISGSNVWSFITEPAPITPPEPASPLPLYGDLDGDHHPDLLLQSKASVHVQRFLNGLPQGPLYSNVINFPSPAYKVTATRDLNNDGQYEILAAKGKNVLARTLTTNFTSSDFTAFPASLPRGYKVVSGGRLDSDAVTDLLIQKGSQVAILHGSNFTTATEIFTRAKTGKIIGSGFYGGTGKLDLVSIRGRTLTRFTLSSNGTLLTTSPLGSLAKGGFRPVGSLNFESNGYWDLILSKGKSAYRLSGDQVSTAPALLFTPLPKRTKIVGPR